MNAMLAANAVNGLLVVALAVLAASLIALAAGRSGSARSSTVQVVRPTAPKPVAAPKPAPVVIEHSGSGLIGPTGQTARPPDVLPGERITIETASALAEHYADHDPARIVEVISFWMQEDSDEPGWTRSS
jgi:hypothetical protein